MTGKERLTAAIRGDLVDRVPIWIHGFPIGETLPDQDHFTKGWQAEPEYRQLFEEYAHHTDTIKNWLIGGEQYRKYSELNHINRFMITPPRHIHFKEHWLTPDIKQYRGWIDTPRKRLTFANEERRGAAQFWRVEHAAKSLDDLVALAEIPFDFHLTEDDLAGYALAKKRAGDRGVVMLFISEPMVTISCAIDFAEFLIIAQTEKRILHELLEEMTRREMMIIDAVFRNHQFDTMVILGGCEQATPPMMSPQAFGEYVVPYSGRIIQRLKKYGLLVHVHCHGHVRQALPHFLEMGIDSVDPVEPPPQGDVTYAQARQIVGDRLTLIGNLECSELQNESPQYIRNRVKEILELGNRNLILTDSAPQISAFSRHTADNYRTMIETALEFG